jgi:hypothetical protein
MQKSVPSTLGAVVMKGASRWLEAGARLLGASVAARASAALRGRWRGVKRFMGVLLGWMGWTGGAARGPTPVVAFGLSFLDFNPAASGDNCIESILRVCAVPAPAPGALAVAALMAMVFSAGVSPRKGRPVN